MEEKNNWINPFSVDRVEGWRVEEQPENYKKIAALFAPPDFMDKLEDPAITRAIFMIGGRGCGKSHILKRMAIQSEIKALEAKYTRKLSSVDFDKRYFGIYIKTDCFSPLSKESITYLKDKQLEVLFEHLFNVEVSKAIIEGIRFLIAHFEDNSIADETMICKKTEDYLKQLEWNIGISSFGDLLNCLDSQVNQITKLTKNIIFDNDIGKYLSSIQLTPTPDFILKIYDIIRNEIDLLKNKPLILLLDEYESLDENQQRSINQIIKGRRLTLRIAVKVRGVKTLNTKTSEQLDELHDYEHVDLHFKLDKTNRPKYKLLTKQVFENRLNLKDEYGEYKEKDPKKLLPTPTLEDEEITEEEIENELLKIKDSLKNKDSENNNDYLENFKGHYKKAAIFRILRVKGKDKLFAGFDEYVSLSSGIIRLFIWLCREAFELARREDINIMNGAPVNIKLQSAAANSVSKNELTITIPQTINNIYASKLAHFIYDIGQILRAKLYYSTEPQANRIEIIDPEKFELDDYKIPRELIESGQDLPVLISESSFKPRDVQYPFPKTFALNGIFAPLLRIPLEGRWRTEITSSELKRLCLSESRSETLKKIVNQIKEKERTVRRSADKEDEKLEIQDLFCEIPNPITLENCPVTGKGCDKNLQDYDKSSNFKMHVFLAIPFNEGWVSDPRQWIKDALVECNVACKDVGDFPTFNHILCKICSCVRQYPFGLFEITELNPNVIFEFGMATGLNRTNFLLVFKEQIPSRYKDNFPPAALRGIEYVSYELSSGAVLQKVKQKIEPVIATLKKSDNRKCRIIDSQCPHQILSGKEKKMFIGLSDENNKEFFDEVYNTIKKVTKSLDYILDRHHPAKSLNELCQICKKVRESSFCIIDTTYNDISMLFALGVAFGRDKKFIQLHDTELDPNQPLSDLRPWTIEYKNLIDLENLLKEELPKRLGKI